MFSVVSTVVAIAVGLVLDEATDRLWIGILAALAAALVLHPVARRLDAALARRRAHAEAAKDRRLLDR